MFIVVDNTYMNVLQALLTEVARIRLHGFSEREVRQAQATMLSDVESAYIERDQDNSQVPNGLQKSKDPFCSVLLRILANLT